MPTEAELISKFKSHDLMNMNVEVEGVSNSKKRNREEEENRRRMKVNHDTMSYNVVKHEKNVLRITKNPCAKLDEETISFNVKKRKKPHSLHLTSQRRANNMYRGETGHRVQKKDILCEDLDSDEEYEKENSVPVTHSNSLSACSNSATTFSTICESELKELTKYIRESSGALKLIKENSVAVEDLVDNHRRLDAVQHCCPQLFNCYCR